MKVGIIGIGRTGTMLAFELKGNCEVFGVGKKEEVNLVKAGKVFVQRNGKDFLFSEKIIDAEEFPNGINFDALVLTVKNPIDSVLRYYYQKIKEKNFNPPALFLLQNGIEAGEKAIFILKEIFSEDFKKIPLFRISLFNPIDRKIVNDKIYIVYSLPIKLAISQVLGKNFPEFLKEGTFKVFKIAKKDWKNMEYSKLFLNLIGMASATYNLSIREGFAKKEIFQEEICALREYKKVIQLKGGKFLNFPSYPVQFFSFLVSFPSFFLFLFRNFFAAFIERGRIGKKKDLDEIDFYNGAIVKMARELKISVPTNQKIIERVKCLI